MVKNKEEVYGLIYAINLLRATPNRTSVEEKVYLEACDDARKLFDTVEDADVAMALRLHYVNGMTWRDVAACVGVPTIHAKCKKILKQGV